MEIRLFFVQSSGHTGAKVQKSSDQLNDEATRFIRKGQTEELWSGQSQTLG